MPPLPQPARPTTSVLPCIIPPTSAGDYAHVPITVALSTAEQALFNHSERFDLALYDYGRAIFLNRLQLAGCPLYD